MRTALLALLLVVAGGGAWVLGRDLSPPEPTRPTKRLVTTVARDSSGNGHHAIIQGPVQMGLPGRYRSAFSFSERDAWLMVPPSPDLNPGDHDFLIAAWISLRESPGPGETYDVVRKGIAFTDPGEYKLEVLRHGRVRCTAKDDERHTARVTTDKVDLIDGDWHLIGCARTGPVWSVLADGTVTSRHEELGTVGNEVPLSIGSKYGAEDQPAGRLDDVRLVRGQPYNTGVADRVTRLDELWALRPTARWRLDESPSSHGRRP